MKTKLKSPLIQTFFDFDAPIQSAEILVSITFPETAAAPDPSSTRAAIEGADALFAQWEPLAYKLTAGWHIPGFDREDLQQEARIALHRCAGKFDAARGCFYTIAKHSIFNRLSSLLTRTRAQKRSAVVQSIDDMVFPDGEAGDAGLHEKLSEPDHDCSLPRGVAVTETVLGHLYDVLQAMPAAKRAAYLAGPEIKTALVSFEEAYGVPMQSDDILEAVAGLNPARRLADSL